MAKRKTTEEFIKDARKVHGDKYDYSKVEYIRANIKVCIICSEHGEFWQTPAAHLSKQDCPKCAEIKKRISLKTDWNEILYRFKKIHGNRYEYKESNFNTQHDKIKIYCKYHKFWFDQQIVHHLNGHGCPICSGGGKWTTEMFVIKSKEIHGNKYDYSKSVYKNKNTKVEIVCPKHGSFWQKAHDHTSGCGCPKCAEEIVLGSIRSNVEDFIYKSIAIHGNKYNYSQVKYINNRTPVKIICPKHGAFWQNPRDHLKGHGCNKCTLKSQEKIYAFIKKCFPLEVWSWEFSPSWLGLQKFDIYNHKHNLAIEYNGEQHYFPVKKFGGEIGYKKCVERDLHKARLCKENNCNLYVIKYDNVDYNKIKKDITKILNNNLYENCIK